ncbi:hypothetical protein K402DRAFT_420510 [Aulographum hederae CBS 113979]|uniref:Thioesterase domain-containing protein n=1 Tax=Aulographum hederae CBS 113979 TaxID=1176131 RepID=A0A6G1H2Q8_9PEZI|nr:hypothetical protein K402DRAFT_420510 [Aulographum hederae CBS 113979]
MSYGSAALAHFKQIPWCDAILTDPGYCIIPTPSREVKFTGEDSFFSETLQTNRTIQALLSVCSKPDMSTSPLPIREVRMLVAIGDALNGHVNTAHGGLLGCLLDEAMGTHLGVNIEFMSRKEVAKKLTSTMTAYLNVSYKRPVPTPGVVLVRTKIVKSEGRKRWVKGTIEDEQGNVLTIGEALFLGIKKIEAPGMKL